MAVDYKVIAVGREPNNGRRYITVEMVFSGPIGTITKNINHLNPKSPDFQQDLRQYVRAFAQGMRAARQMQNSQPSVPALSPAEEAALIAVPADDTEAGQ